MLENFPKGGHLQLADSFFFAPTVSANWREYCRSKKLNDSDEQINFEKTYLYKPFHLNWENLLVILKIKNLAIFLTCMTVRLIILKNRVNLIFDLASALDIA